MKTIKQPDSWSCTICCIQMATLKSRQEVLEALPEPIRAIAHKEGVSENRFIPFLYKNRIMLGTKGVLDEAQSFDSLETLEFSLPTKERPAFIVVESQRLEGKNHLVFWDGKNIRDPNPEKNEVETIQGYKVKEWTPLTFLSKNKLAEILNYYNLNK